MEAIQTHVQYYETVTLGKKLHNLVIDQLRRGTWGQIIGCLSKQRKTHLSQENWDISYSAWGHVIGKGRNACRKMTECYFILEQL